MPIFHDALKLDGIGPDCRCEQGLVESAGGDRLGFVEWCVADVQKEGGKTHTVTYCCCISLAARHVRAAPHYPLTSSLIPLSACMLCRCAPQGCSLYICNRQVCMRATEAGILETLPMVSSL